MKARLLALTLALAGVSAAARRAEAQVRGGARVGVELEPARRWQITVYERALFGYRVPDTGRYQTQVEAAFDATRFLRVGAGYRVGFSEGYDSIAARQRVHLEARLDWHWRWLRLAYRLRVQGAFERRPMYLDADAYVRNRASVHLRPVSVLEFGASVEAFSQIDEQPRALARVRVEAGVTLRLRPLDVGFEYRYDTPVFYDGHPYHQLLGTLTFKWEAPRPHPNRERRQRDRERERERGREREGAREQAPEAAPSAPSASPEQSAQSAP